MACAFELGDLYTNKFGRKSARLRGKDTNEPIALNSKHLMTAPFGPSSGDVRRTTLSIQCDDIVTLAFFEEVDKWALAYLTENSERVLGEKMTAEQVAASYKPCLRMKASQLADSNYAPLLHAKITLEGANPTRFWDELKQRREPPEPSAWRNSPALFRFSVPQLWIMPGQCGMLVNVTDCKLFPRDEPVVCPL
jgi:hypothetical protein